MACFVCKKTGIRHCGEDGELVCSICGFCAAQAAREDKLPTTAELKLREDMKDGYE